MGVLEVYFRTKAINNDEARPDLVLTVQSRNVLWNTNEALEQLVTQH